MKTIPYFRLLPLAMLLLVVLAVGAGLFEDKDKPPASRVIGLNVAPFEAPILGENTASKIFTPDAWKDQIVVLNVFASWCEPCVADHAQMMKLAKSGKVSVMGIAWKDDPLKVLEFLRKHGNPYQLIAIDKVGESTVPLALSGVPETFLIDRKGTIVYNYKSFMTDEEMANGLLPKLNELLQAQHVSTPPAPAQ